MSLPALYDPERVAAQMAASDDAEVAALAPLARRSSPAELAGLLRILLIQPFGAPAAAGGASPPAPKTTDPTMIDVNIEDIARRVFAALNTGDLDVLARRVAAMIGPSEAQSLARSIDLLGCSMLIAPRTLAAKLGEDRDRYVPDLDAAPSTVLNGLAPQATSTPLVISAAAEEPIPRVFQFDEVTLDPGTSFQDIVMSVYVGGIRLYRLSGLQLNPTTENACVTRALCGMKVCVGALQDLDLRFTNVSTGALGGAASVRVHGRIAFPGDADFVDCWSGECKAQRIPTTAGGGMPGSCACQK